MAPRPRRSAATKATESISVQSKWADGNETSERNPMPSRRSGRAAARDASSPESQDIPTSRSRQAARSSRRSGQSEAGENTRSQRSRGAKKNYVIDSSPDDDDEDIEDEVEVELDEDEAMDDGDEDAEGEEEMDVDADGEEVDAEGEDAEGDVDMDTTPRKGGKKTIKVNSRSARSRPAARAATSRVVPDDDDDDDDELSEPADSDLGDGTGFGDETMADQDAEGEEIEVAGDGEDGEEDEEEEEEEEEEEGEEEEEEEEEGDEGQEDGEGGELDSDEDGSRAGTPDLAKMTKRQRARFEEPQEYMKLSDEVQAKKVFTAEELSMRRQEMARRRRNLSEKRNEEVKMETINKLLKKQAPKVNKKAAAMRDSPEADEKPNMTYIRWISTKSGSKVAVPEEIIAGPVGDVFTNGERPRPKVVEEVA